MFIIIHESGDMVKARELSCGDVAAADDGVVDLVDLSEVDNPKRYYEGVWVELDLV